MQTDRESSADLYTANCSANIFSRLTFSWMGEMMYRGTEHTLDESDLWDLPKEDSAEGLSTRLGQYWRGQLEKKK